MCRPFESVFWTSDFSWPLLEGDWVLSSEMDLATFYPSHLPWVRLWDFRWYDIYSNSWHFCAWFITILVYDEAQRQVSWDIVGLATLVVWLHRTSNQQVSKGSYFALHLHIDCFTLVYIDIYVCWGGITTPIFSMILLSRLRRSVGYARYAELLMCSMVSTCPWVGAISYPCF